MEYHLADSQVRTFSSCPSSVHWSDDGLERDLYIQTTTVTVLAMDGRRRWLDIQKLVSLAEFFISTTEAVLSFFFSDHFSTVRYLAC